uniref:Chitin-binding type-2 domain-containing protein n=1 Tax=Anopheles dirus TaxID=7168 RepID=A0A182NDG6_9DIPT
MNRSWLLTVLGVVLTVPSVVLANRCAGQPDGLFIADFTDCQAFFTCFRGEPFPGRCTFDYLFNEAAQICDFKWNVKCLICPQDSDVPTLEPIEGECSYYALCFQGVGSLRQCADGLLFDTVAGQCDLPEIANCDAGVCPTNVDPNVPVSVPHPDDCSKYYVCLRNEGTEMQCAPTLLFNPETNLCDLEENVECYH